MEIDDKKLQQSIFTARQAMDVTLKRIEQARSDPLPGLPLYLPTLDEYWRRMKGAGFFTILASTSNYKTGLMTYLARKMSSDLVPSLDPHSFRQRQGLVFFATWEDSVEKLSTSYLGNHVTISADDMLEGNITNEQMERIRTATYDVSESPTIFFGHSEYRPSERPMLSLKEIDRMMYMTCNVLETPPSVVFLDYLQRIRPDTGGGKRGQFQQIVESIKNLSLKWTIPFIVGCQAGRQVDLRDIKIPQRGDGQETSNIEQSSDGMLALFMPKTDPDRPIIPGDPKLLDYRYGVSENVFVTDDLLLIRPLKQKRGPTGMTLPFKVDFIRNDITALGETDDVDTALL